LLHERQKRSNHSDDTLSALLEIPRHDQATENGRSLLVTTKAAWRQELEKWQEDVQAEEVAVADEEEEAEDDAPAPTQPSATTQAPRRTRRLLPCKLQNLFGGQAARPLEVALRPQRRFDDEYRRMELIAAEPSDEEPDDGELTGSEDNYGE
jgi:hypothetical protein